MDGRMDAHLTTGGNSETGFGGWPDRDDSIAFVLGTNPEDWLHVVEIARKGRKARGGIGLHPWFVTSVDGEAWRSRLRQMLESHPDLHMGEIGLDKAWRPRDGDGEYEWSKTQVPVLKYQLELAGELGRIASIHCVRAHGEMLEVLFATKPFPLRVNLHSWSGSADMTRQILGNKEIGKCIYFGVSAVVNLRGLVRFDLDSTTEDVFHREDSLDPEMWFKVKESWICKKRSGFIEDERPWRDNARSWERFQQRIVAIPVDRILLESDLPCMDSFAVKRRNGLELICMVVADALLCDFETLWEQCKANLENFLGFHGEKESVQFS